jgi:pimeloyl-ACP methyl ester carboxylesterase
MRIEVNSETVYCYTNSRGIDPGKPSIVFIHGSGMDHTVWTLASRHFARQGNNVVSIDLPGHGRSGGSPLASVTEMASWIISVLDTLAIDQAALVGHSLGSLIALESAANAPGRVRAIALVGTTAPMPVSDAILKAAEADDHAAFDMLTQWGFSKRHQFGGNRTSGIWMMGNTLRLYERSKPGVLFHDMRACNDYTTGIEQAAKVRCPALLILGAEDRLTPVRGTRALQEALAWPEINVLPGSGHTIMVEAPNAMLDALRGLL